MEKPRMGLFELFCGHVPRLATPKAVVRIGAIALTLTVAVELTACQTRRPPPPPPPPPAPLGQVYVPPPPPPPPPVMEPSRMEQPNYYRLRNTSRDTVPARVALLLPFSSTSAEVRGLADALQKAAELALFDSGTRDILLMPRDDGGTPERAAEAAAKAIEDGAEIIIGPLFAQSVGSVAPIARAGKVPVVAFSTDRSVGGRGVYLLSFQPANEVRRIVNFAAQKGHSMFGALVPRTPYGDVVAEVFRSAVTDAGGTITALQTFDQRAEAVVEPARGVAQSAPNAVLIGEGGTILQAIGSALVVGGADNRMVQFLGTGLWDDPSVQREPVLANGWFAAPNPEAFRSFSAHYRMAFNTTPPRIATLSYDAMSLVALLAGGRPYERFTEAALTDPNGFAGVDGIFRFRDDGSTERGLAVLQVSPSGFTVVDPAPQAFPAAGF
jgi:ABC-type branched-subunit amino acid transport system substrate-binding protein